MDDDDDVEVPFGVAVGVGSVGNSCWGDDDDEELAEAAAAVEEEEAAEDRMDDDDADDASVDDATAWDHHRHFHCFLHRNRTGPR